jgi:hypothetical protein
MSLIEVLIAFVILSMAMAVILRINATSLRNHEVSKQYLKAVQIAESRLTEMGMDNHSIDLMQDGVEGRDGFSWHYLRQSYNGWSDEKYQGLPAVPVEEHMRVAWNTALGEREIVFSRVSLIFPAR